MSHAPRSEQKADPADTSPAETSSQSTLPSGGTRRRKSAEERLRDIEAAEKAAIERVRARAAERKSVLEAKSAAKSQRARDLEQLGIWRSQMQAALGGNGVSASQVDMELHRIVEAGIASTARRPGSGEQQALGQLRAVG